jgi:ABC-type molybdenum transport system ATPase subunit/photorepair protein PhrA
MRLTFPPLSLLLALGIPAAVESFSIPCRRQNSLAMSSPPPPHRQAILAARAQQHDTTKTTTTMLYAKKKSPGGKTKDAALAALEAMERQESAGVATTSTAPPAANAKKPNNTATTLDFLLLDDDAPLTKKEQMELEKKRQKEAKKAKQDSDRMAAAEMEEIEKNKRKKALKALAEMEAMEKTAGMVVENNTESGVNGDTSTTTTTTTPTSSNINGESSTLSKKEAKMAAKKAEKEAEKLAMKAKMKEAKKLGISVEELESRKGEADDLEIDGADDLTQGVNGRVNGDGNSLSDEGETIINSPDEQQTEARKDALTAEERIRKDRPPPRIRIMESSQPDYTALRLENIAITFRDQPVLKSATWGVQTGDRIGLVGANGAGKTTQLRILAGELEPTAGDVVKSHRDLRVAMLRQEFIDEIDLTRTLREEFISVFTEEAEIMAQLSQAEKELESMTGDASDAEAMQEVLDRMAKLQVKADSKNVNVLDSRVSKIMDLMGFDPEEGGE